MRRWRTAIPICPAEPTTIVPIEPTRMIALPPHAGRTIEKWNEHADNPYQPISFYGERKTMKTKREDDKEEDDNGEDESDGYSE
jgi:hypothetical protein